jgi:hypothetical protein
MENNNIKAGYWLANAKVHFFFNIPLIEKYKIDIFEAFQKSFNELACNMLTPRPYIPVTGQYDFHHWDEWLKIRVVLGLILQLRSFFSKMELLLLDYILP